MRIASFRLLGFVLALFAAVSTSAQVIVFDSTQSGVDAFDSISDFGPLANSFTSPSYTSRLTGLDLYLNGNGGSGGIVAALFTSTSDPAPSALVSVLGSLSNDSIVTTGQSFTLSLVSTPTLQPNTRYWIGLADVFGTGDTGWGYANNATGVGVAGEYWFDGFDVTANQSGTTPYMMTVSVTPVPEPIANLEIAGLALLAWSGIRWLRR